MNAETIGSARREELGAALARVRSRIAEATATAGRADEPELVVVTKYFPASDVLHLASLGVTDVGENREQEAGPKAAEVASLVPQLRWHFIGQLQSNKANRVARFAHAVHSVDRPGLVSALAKGVRAAAEGVGREEPLECYLQVDLRTEASGTEDPAAPRGGALPGDIAMLADAVASHDELRLRGLMAVAPLGEDPVPAFARLAELSQRLRVDHPEAGEISAGMSSDLEAAVAAGATRLRIGSDVLGPRPPLR